MYIYYISVLKFVTRHKDPSVKFNSHRAVVSLPFTLDAIFLSYITVDSINDNYFRNMLLK